MPLYVESGKEEKAARWIQIRQREPSGQYRRPSQKRELRIFVQSLKDDRLSRRTSVNSVEIMIRCVSETPWTCVLLLSPPGSTSLVSQCRDKGGESVVGHGRRLRRNLAAAAPPPKVVALPTIPSPIAGHRH